MSVDILNRIRDVVVFSPSEAQKRARSNFWTAAELDGIEPGQDVPLATALKYGQDKRITGWYTDQQFRDWFQNGTEFKQKADYLAQVALDELEQMIRDRTGSASARVQAMKITLEIAGKLGKQAGASQASTMEDKIADMNRTELEAYISAKLDRLSPTPASPKKEDN